MGCGMSKAESHAKARNDEIERQIRADKARMAKEVKMLLLGMILICYLFCLLSFCLCINHIMCTYIPSHTRNGCADQLYHVFESEDGRCPSPRRPCLDLSTLFFPHTKQELVNLENQLCSSR